MERNNEKNETEGNDYLEMMMGITAFDKALVDLQFPGIQ